MLYFYKRAKAPKSLQMVTVAMKLRHLLLGRKAMTNLDSVLKSRDITLPTKICIVKDMVFAVVTYRCESWTMKKAEYQRIDAFEMWCWRRLLRAHWTARRSNQSILKEEISLEYSLEGLKLKLQYFGHLIQKADSLEKTLMLGKIEDKRRGQQRIRWLGSITNSMDMNPPTSGRWWRTGEPGSCSPWSCKESDTIQQLNKNNWGIQGGKDSLFNKWG